MSHKKPYFSILIPSYNRPEYITKSLDSILANDFKEYEIIISDDNSPKGDEIERVITPYLKNKNIRFFRQPVNLREPGNKNFLVEKATGEFNIVLGDDDMFYPNALSRMKQYIDKNPGYKLYGLGYTIIDENDKFYYSRHAPKGIEISLSDLQIIKEFFILDIFPFWLFHPATFCCKNGVEKELSYSKKAGIGEDFMLLLDYINKGEKIFIIPETFFFWRKVQSVKTNGQINQSLGDFNNVVARKNIYYQLKNKKDLQPVIAEYISSYEFRKKFLYNSMIVEKNVTDEKIQKLELDKTMLVEYKNYSEKANFFDKQYKPYINRSIRFINLFGLKGFVNVSQVSFQRAFYKFTTLFSH